MPFRYEKHKNSASNPYRRFGAVCIQRNKAIIARFLATTDVISGKEGIHLARMSGV